MVDFILLLVLVIICEAITEVVVKSSIFDPLHKFLERNKRFKLFDFSGQLVSCGYCFSMWASIFINLFLLLFSNSSILLNIFDSSNLFGVLLNFFFSVILVHRLSNFLHGLSDRYFDTRKDNRYLS